MTDTSRFLVAAAVAACLSFGSGCEYLRQDMANQPKNRPLSPSEFFVDGRSERPLVENAVARGALVDDELFLPKDSNNFPLPVDLKLLERGEERYKIFCSPCHGLQGDGNGMVAVRGMKSPTGLARCWAIPPRFPHATAGPLLPTFARCSSAATPRPPICPRSFARSSIKVQLRPPNQAGRTIREEAASNGCAGISSAGKR